MARLLGVVGAIVVFLALAAPASAAPPINDNFESPQALSGSSATATGTNAEATKQTAAGEPNHAGSTGGASVWYSWIAPSSGLYRVNTCASSFDTLLAVYTGSAVGSLTGVRANDDGVDCGLRSQLVFQAVSGTTYRIAVDGFGGGTGSIGLALAPEPLPANDSFASAQVLPGADVVQATGDNFGATKQIGEPNPAGDLGGASVWYRWTPPISGLAYVDACCFDSLVGVYTGNSVSSLTEIASDFGFLEFQAVAGTQYRILVDGFSDSGLDPPAQDFFFLYADVIPPQVGSTVLTVPQLGKAADKKAPQSKIKKVVVDDEAGKAKITFGSSESGSSYRCKLDRKPYRSCKSPKTYRNLDEGKHKIKVQARDAAGNLDKSAAVRSFRIDSE